MKAQHVAIGLAAAAGVYFVARALAPPPAAPVTTGGKIGAGLASVIDGIKDLWSLREIHGGANTGQKPVSGAAADGDSAVSDAEGHNSPAFWMATI